MKLSKPDIDAPMIDHALWWASRGWRVFPVWWPVDGNLCGCGQLHTNNDSGKHPITKCAPKGFHNGTTDPKQVRQWWTMYPLANIGSTPPAGQVVIDIDGPLDEGVSFPDTQSNLTGKGRHLIYINNLEKPLEQTNPQNAYWTNVDTRISGAGYIILPPSKHKSGVRYAVENDCEPIEFPLDLAAAALANKRVKKASKPVNDEIIKLLTMDRDAPELGDDAMARIGGWLARYLPTKEHYEAVLSAINQGLADPLDQTALNKKRGIWDKHQETIEKDHAKAESDEARGWLYEMGDVGYSTEIDVKGTVEYVPFNDFRVHCRGVIKGADSRVFIVDFYRNDKLICEGEKLSASTLAFPTRLREWLANRGMLLHQNQKDTRQAYGMRLMSLMMSQNPVELEARDYYGWCDKTQAFITDKGEITKDGLRPYTDVYPNDDLSQASPVNFVFDADIEQSRTWLKRLLALQPEQESVKVGSWAMMTLLKGQYEGLLPGLSVDAFAGTGKTTFFKLLSRMLGSTSEGESMTLPVARAQLAGNLNGFVWLDDSAIDAKMQELLRLAVTGQKQKKMGVNALTGDWGSSDFQLRGSAIISGEGSDLFRQKAMRDRFVPVDFVVYETPDAEKLMNEHIERGSGALLMEVLKQAHLLPQLEKLRDGISNRERQSRTTLRIGARILDAVLQTGTKWSDLADAWYEGKSRTVEDMGNASVNVLNVFPTVWHMAGNPTVAGYGEQVNGVWFNEDNRCFYISCIRAYEVWQTRKVSDARERQLTSAKTMATELNACGAETDVAVKTKVTQGGVKGKTVKYFKLNERYSKMILDVAEHVTEEA